MRDEFTLSQDSRLLWGRGGGCRGTRWLRRCARRGPYGSGCEIRCGRRHVLVDLSGGEEFPWLEEVKSCREHNGQSEPKGDQHSWPQESLHSAIESALLDQGKCLRQAIIELARTTQSQRLLFSSNLSLRAAGAGGRQRPAGEVRIDCRVDALVAIAERRVAVADIGEQARSAQLLG